MGACIFAQYPADSLFQATDTSPMQKLFLFPITKWQRMSYNSDAMNCQFYPSCSNYGAQAIYQNGIISGLVMTSDRIIRCNPQAFDAHKRMNGNFHIDERLMDPIHLSHDTMPKRSPLLAAGLSMAVPGLGRVYGGRTADGFYGFLMSAISISTGVKSLKRESIFAPLYIGLAVTIYGGEIYGAWRTTKYYRKVD